MFVNTVEDKKKKYTKRVYYRAMMAWKLQNNIGYLSTRTYPEVVEDNLL